MNKDHVPAEPEPSRIDVFSDGKLSAVSDTPALRVSIRSLNSGKPVHSFAPTKAMRAMLRQHHVKDLEYDEQKHALRKRRNV